ncbi:halocyanin domain-containing protein [Haladaptatus sp. DYF46]|uniref:halocyanin domain-containing protein n=1 Tax=Haladaptatus sp. DYF46 TaxID=2886041 RepID=UPI001E2B2D46|nr:halocyanin domain-containing protein [Haladaptatus sp. DYF46]
MSPNPSDESRRTYIKASSALLTGGFLAGCTSGEAETEDSKETEDDKETEDGNSTSNDTATESGSSLSDDAVEYLSDARSYSGDGPEDYTGRTEVEVENGGGSRGKAFDPAAIRIDAGTTVVWKWTGRGGKHDVVAVDGSFESELVESSSKTFSHTFEETGETLYNCSEHEDKGMKGVVVVV